MDTTRSLSVTANDSTSPVMRFLMLDGLSTVPALYRDPPNYWSRDRDLTLRATVLRETQWATAVGIAMAKVSVAGYKIKGNLAPRVQRMHRLLQLADFGKGYMQFMAKLARDFLLTDNGAFVEIVRASAAPGSRIVGLAHLDSLRCWRTGDDDIPVVYTDKKGQMHELMREQVFTLADMPGSSEDGRGVGLSAASRAYATLYKMWALDTLISEAAAGRSPTKLTFVGGINQRAVEDAITTAKAQADAEKLQFYMGAAVVASPTDKPLSTVEVALREIPTGIDVEKERTDAWLKFANAIGLDPQELQPLSGSALGTATQSEVLDDKASGKGIQVLFGQFVEQLNLRVMAQGCTFAFEENDVRDQRAQAEVREIRARTRAAMVTTGEISAVQAQQMAIEDGDIPRAVIPDQTPGDVVTSADPADDSLEAQVSEAFTAEVVRIATPGADLANKIRDAFVKPNSAGVATPTPTVAKEQQWVSRLIKMTRDKLSFYDRNGNIRVVSLENIPEDELALFSEQDRRYIGANMKRRQTVGKRLDARWPNRNNPEEKAATEKRRAGVLLVEMAPKGAAQLQDGSPQLEKVTRALDEYGRILALACRQEAPQSGVIDESGKLVDSIRFRVVNRDTPQVALQLWAGNQERPEVVIRSNLYGRRGFGPKDPEGWLAFKLNGQQVFTKHVGPADPNNWLQRAWDKTESQRRSLYARAGAFERTMIDEGDVELSSAEHIDS